MGCGSSRTLGCEEISLIYAEAALNFKHIRLKSFTRALKRYSINHLISSHELLQLSEKYDFKFANFSVHQHIEKFYESLKVDESQFNQQDIFLLAILLSEKKVETKSKLLFEYFTDGNSNEIPKKLIEEQIMKPMFILSSLNLVVLVNAKHVDKQVESMIEKYSENLIHVIEIGIKRLSKDYFYNELITFADFSKLFNQRPDLLMASGIRYYLSLIVSKKVNKKTTQNKEELNK